MRFIANAIRALRTALQPRRDATFDPPGGVVTQPESQKIVQQGVLYLQTPLKKIADDNIRYVLERCKNDLPPVAGLFWCEAEGLAGIFVVQLVNQSPKDTDWWGLHTEETISAWLAQLPSTAASRGNATRKAFQSLNFCVDKDKVVAISALFLSFMRPESLLAVPKSNLLLRHSPAPAFMGAEDMPLTEGFLPKRMREEPMGAWMPMFKDDQGRTHDLLDAMLINPERLEGAIGLFQEFAPISSAAKECYLSRQMARFSDVLHHELLQKSGEGVPRFLPDAGPVQSFLLAGVSLPINAWSAKEWGEERSRALWRPPLMQLLTLLDTYHGNSMRDVFADVVKRLMAHGHDVMGKGPQAGPPAAQSLMYFAKIQSHDAVALMLRLGADPDERIWKNPGCLSVREFVAAMGDARMAHLLRTHKSSSAARSILEEMDEETTGFPPSSPSQGFLTLPNRLAAFT